MVPARPRIDGAGRRHVGAVHAGGNGSDGGDGGDGGGNGGGNGGAANAAATLSQYTLTRHRVPAGDVPSSFSRCSRCSR